MAQPGNLPLAPPPTSEALHKQSQLAQLRDVEEAFTQFAGIAVASETLLRPFKPKAATALTHAAGFNPVAKGPKVKAIAKPGVGTLLFAALPTPIGYTPAEQFNLHPDWVRRTTGIGSIPLVLSAPSKARLDYAAALEADATAKALGDLLPKLATVTVAELVFVDTTKQLLPDAGAYRRDEVRQLARAELLRRGLVAVLEPTAGGGFRIRTDALDVLAPGPGQAPSRVIHWPAGDGLQLLGELSQLLPPDP